VRVLFVTFPAARSHLYVMTPLAWALRTAGHQVVVAGTPDLAGDIAGAGLTGLSVGEPIRELLRQVGTAVGTRTAAASAPGPPRQEDYGKDDPRAELEFLTRETLGPMVTDTMLGDLVDFAREWQPDLVIWDQLLPGGSAPAQAVGAAHARFLYGNDTLTQLRSALPPGSIDPLHEWVREKLGRFGLELDEHSVEGHWSIDSLPSWTYHPAGPDYLRVRHLPFNGSAPFPRWVCDPPPRPRVCITLGLSHRELGLTESSPADFLEAVEGLDAEVIATFTKDQLEQVAVPDNVRPVDFVPLNALLPSCSAIVHHGGAGAFGGAVENGVPQLIVPGDATKWFGPVSVANGLERQGAGILVSDAAGLTPELLRVSLKRMLDDPSFATNAERLRLRNAETPGPNDIVAELERRTARHTAGIVGLSTA
jgi:glycosyltransferase (activator-dependent family)